MRNFRLWRGSIAVLLLFALLLPTLSGCDTQVAPLPTEAELVETEPAPTETVPETTAPTEPPATTPADGDPNDVTCQGSYSVGDFHAEVAADAQVATITVTRTELVEKEPESTEATQAPAGTNATEPPVEYEEVTTVDTYSLTNGLLQIYYWMEVAAYQSAGHEIVPDFGKPLDTQVCPLDDTVNSWQQYFLREALNTWSQAQALTIWGNDEGIPVTEAYKIREDLHEKHLTDEIPATRLLYGYNEGFQPNALHQAYLDGIPTMLESLAAESGFATVDALAQDFAGSGADGEALAAYADLYNRGYMFLTELGYWLEITDEEVETWFAEHESDYAAQGITRDSGKYVDMRHILLIPEGAEVAADGTVTATDAQWKTLNWQSQSLMSEFYNTYPYTEGVFATMAANRSADPGSAMNGGQYRNLVQGQLTEELDSWLFAPEREPGDTTIIRTSLGMHLVYFSAGTDFWYAAARDDLLTAKYQALTAEATEKYPAVIDYSAITLGSAHCGSSLTPDVLLYSDVAHQRYPEAPLYLQQDYQGTRYGAYSVVTHGCGITTMAMTATYMSDTEYTVPTLCAMYGRYCSEHGTDRTMFVHNPGDLGFYLKKQVFNPSQAYEALEQGYVVVGLQHEGYWTRGGHYLLLEKMNEDGTIVVRDSNIYNYNKLEGHYIDAHEWSTIPGAAISFWIYYPKYTSCSQCVRCADGTGEMAPEALFNGEYQCANCNNALLRRNTYLNN